MYSPALVLPYHLVPGPVIDFRTSVDPYFYVWLSILLNHRYRRAFAVEVYVGRPATLSVTEQQSAIYAS